MIRNERFEDVIYAVELYLPNIGSWHRLCNFDDLDRAKDQKDDYELNDIFFCQKMDYRIMKITIKKEVVG
jgi:hypothetical protein